MSEVQRQVLVVEDEPLVLESTVDLLVDAGFGVVRARTCEEAMAALEAGFKPSVMVTDISLADGGDGLELARCVSELWPSISIVLVSGAQRPSREDYPEGALFFTKPYAPGALVAVCSEQLAA
ncbi:MAG: response regulator [Pseudomonadota bacterium]|nr:response regulator [Pseudomonadota bacterium]